MGIMDKIFGGGQQQQQQAQPAQTTTPGQIPADFKAATPATSTSDANGVIPPNATGNADGAADAGEKSPLDAFGNLWDNSDNAKNEQQLGVLGEISPQKIAEAASKVNFAKVVKPEDLTAIREGGDGAVQALANALNSATQAVYAQSALASSKLIEQATNQLEERILAKLPDQVRRNLLDNSMVEENAALTHPAAAPLVKLVQNQLATKYPDATPSQLKKMATDYFNNSMQAITGVNVSNTQQPQATKSSPAEIDWSAELDL